MKINSKWPFEFFIGLRYLKKSQKTFISVITSISIIGVMVGVMALIIVLSVMSGFDDYLKEKIIGINSEIVVSSMMSKYFNYGSWLEKQIKTNKNVKDVSPVLVENGLIKSNYATVGVVIKGVIPEKDKNVTGLYNSIITDKSRYKSDEKGIFIGFFLARKLGVNINDYIYIMPPKIKISPLGILPGLRKLKIAGIFKSGMYEYDANLVYMNISTVQKITNNRNKISEIEIKLLKGKDAELTARQLNKKLGTQFYSRSWLTSNIHLFKAIKLEKIVMFIILSLIIAVAALNIASTLIVMAIEKTKEIGILRTMGASKKMITKIFLIKGFLIGIFGTITGFILGLGVILFIKYYKIKIPGDVYYIDYLPVQISPFDIAIVCITAIIICIAASVYPAYKASKLNPAEALRYE